MKILLTGSSGLLGNAVLNEATRLGQERNITFGFVGLDVRESTFTPPSLEFHQGSFTDAALIEKLLPGCDAVIHTAAYHGGFLETHTPTEFVEVNAGGQTTLLEACVKHGVRRFVFSSTMEILVGRDWTASGMARLDESCPPRPQTIYPQSKLLCESLGQYYAAQKGIEFLALRYQNIDPPNASPLGLLARGVTAADAARANLLAAIVKDISYDMMLIGPASPLQNIDMIKAQSDPESILEKYWPGATKVLLENNLKPKPCDFWPAVSIDHARRVLGWEPEQTFERWLREHGWH
jgi:nucleoside-diphosphate-sugar epimerase